MEEELHAFLSYVPPPKPKKQRIQPYPITLCVMSINLISAAAFHFNLRRLQNELFSTSLYKTDRLIKDKEIVREIK